MQKVSKQSLAMLALSILLAISIALTFTFANLYDTKTATGTISFEGTVAIQFGTSFTESEGSYSLSLTANSTGINIPANATIGLTGESTDAYLKITISELSGNNVSSTGKEAVTVALADDISSETYTTSTADGIVITTKSKVVAGTSGNIALSDLIKFTVNLDNLVDETTVEFTITVNADVDNTFPVHE